MFSYVNFDFDKWLVYDALAGSFSLAPYWKDSAVEGVGVWFRGKHNWIFKVIRAVKVKDDVATCLITLKIKNQGDVMRHLKNLQCGWEISYKFIRVAMHL